MADLLLYLAIQRIPFLRGPKKLLLSDVIDSSESLCKLRADELSVIVGKSVPPERWNPEKLLHFAMRDEKYLTLREIGYTFYWDPDYPPQLKEIYDPPFGLYVFGKWPKAEVPSLGIVGTRRPTALSARAAYSLGKDSASAGVPVVSGLALGIDESAHRGALDGGGITAAVLGCGIDQFYPKANARLGARIVRRGGCLVSEYPPGEPPLRYHFPERNRIIAGLSRGVAVIEAPKKSGALITADYALEEGRDLFVHSSGLKGMNRIGCEGLFFQGAPVVSSFEDICNHWNLPVSKNDHRKECEKPGKVCKNSAQAGKMIAEQLKQELFCP